jgi:hypothetical protein
MNQALAGIVNQITAFRAWPIIVIIMVLAAINIHKPLQYLKLFLNCVWSNICHFRFKDCTFHLFIIRQRNPRNYNSPKRRMGQRFTDPSKNHSCVYWSANRNRIPASLSIIPFSSNNPKTDDTRATGHSRLRQIMSMCCVSSVMILNTSSSSSLRGG